MKRKKLDHHPKGMEVRFHEKTKKNCIICYILILTIFFSFIYSQAISHPEFHENLKKLPLQIWIQRNGNTIVTSLLKKCVAYHILFLSENQFLKLNSLIITDILLLLWTCQLLGNLCTLVITILPLIFKKMSNWFSKIPKILTRIPNPKYLVWHTN